MQASITSVFSVLATMVTVAIQVSAQSYPNQTAPFSLFISSGNKSIDCSYLTACHEGAAIEGLCLSSGHSDSISSSVFFLNYTSQQIQNPDLGVTGLLTWVLHGSNFNLSSPMKLSYNPTSNVAGPLFMPSETGTIVGFDNRDKLFIPGYEDDTVSPSTYSEKAYYNWYICDTNLGYRYTTLAWVMGVDSVPQNPSCQKVDVIREFF